MEMLSSTSRRKEGQETEAASKIEREREKETLGRRGVSIEEGKRGIADARETGRKEGLCRGGKQGALRVDPRAESSIKLNNISVRSLAKKRTTAHGRPTAAGQGWLASQPFPTSVWPQTNFKRV